MLILEMVPSEWVDIFISELSSSNALKQLQIRFRQLHLLVIQVVGNLSPPAFGILLPLKKFAELVTFFHFDDLLARH